MGDNKRIKHVDINNFRAYNGPMVFDFTDESGKPADFVTIYAPNGSGKTSFFDAIEWGLTGGINRLENDIANQNYNGHILKNRDSIAKTADVKITLENDEFIYRRTKEVTDKQLQDYTSGYKKASNKEILKYKKWESLILPHNRIESFVKDNTGAKKYDYWGSYWDGTGQERKQFEFLYNIKKQASNEIEKINLQIEDSETKLNSFKGTSELINNVNKYIENYNTIAIKKEKIGVLNLNFSNTDYSILVNEIESKKENLKIKNEKLKLLLEDVNLLNENFLEEFEMIKKNLDLYNFQFNSWSKILSKAKDKLNYMNQYNVINKNLNINNQQLEALLEIKNKGEHWFREYNNYIEIQAFLNSMLNKRQELDKQISYFEEQKIKLDNEYDNYILKNNLEEKKEKLNEYSISYNKINLRQDINNERIKKLSRVKAQLNNDLKELKSITYEAQNLIVNNINEFSLAQMSITDLNIENKDDIIFELKNLLNKKKEIEKNILINKGKYEAAEQLSNEMSEIIETARKYIITNNSKVCPVCNKEYKSVEELISQTNTTKDNAILEYFNQLNIYKKELEAIEMKIENHVSYWNENVKVIIDKNSEEIVIFDKKRDRVYSISNNMFKRQSKYSCLNEEYFKKLTDLGYFDRKISKNLIDLWYKKECTKKEKKLQDFALKRADLNDEIRKTKENLNNLKKEHETKTKERNYFESSPMNLRYIQILEKNKLSFKYSEVVDAIKSIKEKDFKIKNELNKVTNKLNLLKWIDENKLTYYKNKVECLNNEIKEMNETYNKKYNIYKKSINNDLVNKKLIRNRKNKILKNIQRNSMMLNSISNIKFSGEIKEYLNSKVETESNLSKLYDDRCKCLKTQEQLEQIYTSAKKIIEEKITSVLNTPLINEFYRKIEPHPVMKEMKYSLKFNDRDKPELEILVSNDSEEYLPDWYFSSAQLNVVALTTFLARANSVDYSPIDTILIDDPIGHFDEINILAFVDLIRAMLEKNKKQIIMSTHDEVIYNLLKRKLSDSFYSTKFIELGYRD